jgi:3-phenylpropionate/trans-cinnamate dioxygenase ferredoxin reductase subunit
LIGGGVASVKAAQEIRKRDATGGIIIVSADHNMPYDRPPLSKNFLSNPAMTADDAASKFDNFYPDNQIGLRLNTVVTNINRRAHTVTFQDGTELEYERLLIATGSRPKKLGVYKENSDSIYTLRTIDDASAIRGRIGDSKTVVVVGTGFLGPEVASHLKDKGLDVTLVGPAKYPWQKFASDEIGKFLKEYYESKGVHMLMESEVGGFELPQPDRPLRVMTKNEHALATDFVVLGVGVDINMELIVNAGVEYVRETGADVDEYLQTSDPDIYTAGDVSFFKDIAMDRKWHLEHHLNATWQGEVAGANLAGERKAYDKVPYFFSDFFDLHMILRGDTTDKTFTTVLGSLGDAEFTELYHDEIGTIRAGISISRTEKKLDPISDKLEELIRAKARVQDVTLADFAAPVA